MSKDLAGLPKGWKVLKLGDLGEINGGGTPSTKVPEYWNGEIAWLVPSEVTKNQGLYISKTVRSITKFGLNDCASKLFPIGTVMMTSRATIGEVVINQVPMATNQGFINIGCHENLADNEFLAYWIKKNKTALEARGSGVTFKEISRSIFKTIKISLPPLEEQRAIATTLRTIQTAKEARQKELALERERKAALMDYLFTHGTRNELRKQTELGEISESWEILSFEKVVNITNGQVKPFEKPYIDMLHVGSENIESNTGRLMNLKTNREIKVISGNYYFNKQNILYSKIRPYLNKVAVPEFEGTCSADIYPLSPNESFLSRDFLFQLLLSERFLKQAIKFQERTGIPKINRNQLGMIELTIPSLEEQQEIAEILSSCDAKIATLEREIKLHDELFRAMLEELMTGQLSSLPLA